MPPDPGSTRVVNLATAVHRLVASDPGVPAARRTVAELVRRHDPLAPPAVVDAVVQRVLERVDGLGPLEPLLADPAVTEVLVNGPGPVWVERAGRLEQTSVVVDAAAVGLAVERIVAPLGLRADRVSPLVDARLPDGSRANIVMPPLAIDGPCISIRRFGARRVPLADLCPPGVAELLGWAVRGRCNIVAFGGTGAGKTTLLNALAACIPSGERVVTIEDAAELSLPGDHVVRLEGRPPLLDGTGGVDARALVRNALRMRPDRIVIGEVRGGEVFDMVQAMNTGHEGSLSSCHANAPVDALRRLDLMGLLADVAVPLAAVREQIAASLDLLVQVARFDGGARRVVGVAEVVAPADDGGCPAGAQRVRPLADVSGLLALPVRPARASGAAPADPRWLSW